MRLLGFLRDMSTRRGAAWAVLGGVLLLALLVGAVAGHHGPVAPAASSTPGVVRTMPDVRGELVSIAVPALQAEFPAAQVVVAGNAADTATVGSTYPAAGALMADAGVITLYPVAEPPVTILPPPTEAPTPSTTVDTPAPDTGSGDLSSSGDGGVYVPHPHAHVCIGGRHVHVCS